MHREIGWTPKLAVLLSHPVGAINGGIEIGQWLTAFKAFGITDQMWSQASRRVLRDLAKKGTMKALALNTVENFGVALSAETMQEVAQESTNVTFEAMAVELNKLKGKEFDHITAADLQERYEEVTEQSLRAFGVLLAPGVGISGAIKGMQVRAAQTDEKARKQQIRIVRRKLGGITVERKATAEETEQVGIETEIEPGVFEKLVKSVEKVDVTADKDLADMTPAELTAELKKAEQGGIGNIEEVNKVKDEMARREKPTPRRGEGRGSMGKYD